MSTFLTLDEIDAATMGDLGFLPAIAAVIGAAGAIAGPMLASERARKDEKRAAKAEQQQLELAHRQALERAQLREESMARWRQTAETVAVPLAVVAGLGALWYFTRRRRKR